MQQINRKTLTNLTTEKFYKYLEKILKGEVSYKTTDNRIINFYFKTEVSIPLKYKKVRNF